MRINEKDTTAKHARRTPEGPSESKGLVVTLVCAVSALIAVIVAFAVSFTSAQAGEADDIPDVAAFDGIVTDTPCDLALLQPSFSAELYDADSFSSAEEMNSAWFTVKAAFPMETWERGTASTFMSSGKMTLYANGHVPAAVSMEPEISDGLDTATFSFFLDKGQLDAITAFDVSCHGLAVMKPDDGASGLAAAIDAAVSARVKAVEDARKAEEKAKKASSPIPKRNSIGGSYSDALMIGDSIMVLASWSLYDYLPGITIDAVSGRSLETGGPGEGGGSADGVLDHVRGADRSFSRYVIGTGNNDGYGMDLESAEEIMAELAGKQVYFVTEYVSNNSRGTNNTNSTIAAVCAKYPNAHKIDWYSVVSANASSFLQGDNCHPQTQEARDAYAALVKNALDA